MRGKRNCPVSRISMPPLVASNENANEAPEWLFKSSNS
jgi:hypothetical protein